MSAFGGKADLQPARVRLPNLNVRFSPKRSLKPNRNHEIDSPLSAISGHTLTVVTYSMATTQNLAGGEAFCPSMQNPVRGGMFWPLLHCVPDRPAPKPGREDSGDN